MAWCPKCKLEYRDGLIVCADCGSKLLEAIIEEPELQVIMTTSDEHLAQKFLEFLLYSKIPSGERKYNVDSEEYTVLVSKEDEKEAKKLFKGFYTAETHEPSTKKLQQEDSQEEIEKEKSPEQSSSHIYVKREDKYKDLSSSAQIFYIFGVVGLAYVIINALGVISFIQGTFSYIVYSAMFLGCLFVGFKTQKSAKIAKEEIAQEKDLTNAINEWLKETMTERLFLEIDEDNASEEVKYLTRTNHIKNLLLEKYQGLDDNYADQLIEEYYNEHF